MRKYWLEFDVLNTARIAEICCMDISNDCGLRIKHIEDKGSGLGEALNENSHRHLSNVVVCRVTHRSASLSLPAYLPLSLLNSLACHVVSVD